MKRTEGVREVDHTLDGLALYLEICLNKILQLRYDSNTKILQESMS